MIEITPMKFSQSPTMTYNEVSGYLNQAVKNADEGWFMFDWQVVSHDMEHVFPPLNPTFFVVIRWAKN